MKACQYASDDFQNLQTGLSKAFNLRLRDRILLCGILPAARSAIGQVGGSLGPTVRIANMSQQKSCLAAAEGYGSSEPVTMEANHSEQQSCVVNPMGAGIANLGNTCYVNSVLQAFMSDKVLMQDITIGVENNSSSSTPFSKALIEMYKSRYYTNILHGGDVKEIVGNRFTQFLSCEQQDAHEFFLSCLEIMEKDHTDSCGATDTANLNYALVQEGRFECSSCSRLSEPRKESLTGMSLDIPQTFSSGNSLNELLQFFFLPEELERKCESCEGIYSMMIKKIATAPRALVIHIKRFGFDLKDGSLKKICTPVRIPDRISIDEFLSTPAWSWNGTDIRKASYKLSAVIRHRSDLMKWGHYVVDVRQPGGTWVCFNDGSVSEISPAFQAREGYLCWYIADF